MSDLQRHLTDIVAFAPRQPSILGPGRSRGTMSLPTSPMMGTAKGDLLWTQPLHSARTFLEGVPENSSDNHSPWGSDLPWPSASGTAHRGTSGSQSLNEDLPTLNTTPRKKRAQVRIACTHCQKACKKCSNTRPCDRCVKYGLNDCVDSTRKPRKTGIKRGPYKRRTSARYEPFFAYGTQHAVAQPHLLHAMDAEPMAPPVNGYISPPDPHQGHAQQVREQLALPDSDRSTAGNRLHVPHTAVLQGTLAEALAGPRWIHGHRTDPSPLGDEVLYPPTPNVPFPVSLLHRNDPFSRAVSPIHGDLNSVLRGLQTDHLGKDVGRRALDPLPRLDPTGPISEAPGCEVDFQNPFDFRSTGVLQPHYYSAPSSPVNTNLHLDDTARVGSASEPPTPMNFTMQPQPIKSPIRSSGGTVGGPGAQSPAIIALKKIRKPSLRTLMSHGGSLAPSRQVSPEPELQELSIQSPMLFDQPAVFDEVDEEVSLNSWSMFEPAVKEQHIDEGLGLLGLELGPFQT